MIQADSLGTGLPQTIVAMITSNMTRAGHPCRISVSVGTLEGRRAGLRMDSVIMTDNLATVFESEIAQVIGELPDMDGVEAALRTTLGL